MFVTTHVVAGAALGSVLRDRVELAAAAGFLSHFVLDIIPHWAPGQGFPYLPAAVMDGLVGAGLVGLIALHMPARPAVLAGMLGAALPDMDKPSRLFFGRSPFPARFDHVHEAIQHETGGALRREVVVAAVAATALVVAVLRDSTQIP